MMHRETAIVAVPRHTHVNETLLAGLFNQRVVLRGNIGEGAYSTVVDCSLEGGARLALKIMSTEVFDHRPTCKEVQMYMQKGTGEGDWIDEIDEFLRELTYARYMGREGIGPRVHMSTLLLETSQYNKQRVRSATVILAMDMLLPVSLNASLEPEMLTLMHKMANRKMVCLDIKPAHFMRERRGALQCIDFGSYWCRRRLPGKIRCGKKSRRVMVIFMAAQVCLHTIIYSKETVFIAWLHRALRNHPEAWDEAREVYTHSFVNPIPTTYFNKSGEYIWNNLTSLLRDSELSDGNIVAPNGKPLTRTELQFLITGDV